MIKFNVKLRRNNINKIRAIVEGSHFSLNPVSKIELRIPSLGIIIEDDVGGDYPIKWTHVPEDTGLIELQLGNVDSLLNKFIIEVNGDSEVDSQWITNVSSSDIEKLEKHMFIEGTPITEINEIIQIDRNGNRFKISDPASTTETSFTFSVYEMVKSTIHKCQFFIYNVDYPDGLYWNQIDLDIGF